MLPFIRYGEYEMNTIKILFYHYESKNTLTSIIYDK